MTLTQSWVVGFSGRYVRRSSMTARPITSDSQRRPAVPGRRRALVFSVVSAVPAVVGLTSEGPVIERLLMALVLVWLTRLVAFGLLALALYYRWRVRRERPAAWLCAMATACAAWNLPFVLVAVSHPGDVARIGEVGRPAAILLACLLVMMMLARRGARGPWRQRPLHLGLVVGAVASVVHGGGAAWGPVQVPSLGPSVAAMVVVALLGLVLAGGLGSLRVFPTWFRAGMVVATLAGTVSMVLTQPGLEASAGRTGASLVADVVGCGALVFVGVQLLLLTQVQQAEAVARLAETAADASAHVRANQEMLHEVRSALAGIASASQLLRHHQDKLDEERASRLGNGLGEEIDRVHRLLRAEGAAGPQRLDLAATIAPVVECARASGARVEWEPVHVAVHGRSDDIAEVVHTLLDNARCHAPGSRVRITTLPCRGDVELRVTDWGPGVDPALAGRVFSRGVHAEGSVGEGIGLYVAQRMLAEHGGGLSLSPPANGRGAEFVVRLPRRERVPADAGTRVAARPPPS